MSTCFQAVLHGQKVRLGGKTGIILGVEEGQQSRKAAESEADASCLGYKPSIT